MKVKAYPIVLWIQLPFFIFGTAILWVHYDFWLALGVFLVAVGASIKPLD